MTSDPKEIKKVTADDAAKKRLELRDMLRESCSLVVKIQEAAAKTKRQLADMNDMRTQVEGHRATLARQLDHATGSRDALAGVWLPEGTTLKQAWEADLEGIATGTAPKAKA